MKRHRVCGDQARTIALFATVGGLFGAALIHAVQISGHLAEWWLSGLFFIMLSGLQFALAAWVLVVQSRAALWSVIALSTLAFAIWGLSRGIGLPFGPERWLPERVGRPDLASNALAITTVLGAAWLLGGRAKHLRPVATGTSIFLLSALLGALLAFGLSPQQECAGHIDWPFGPLVPVEGHAMIYETTPPTPVTKAPEVVLVVGYLKNCGARDVVIRGVYLDTTGTGASVESLRVVPAALIDPTNEVSLRGFQERGVPAVGALIPPTSEDPDLALAALLKVHGPKPSQGGFFVNAVYVSYDAGWRDFRAPYGSAARLDPGRD